MSAVAYRHPAPAPLVVAAAVPARQDVRQLSLDQCYEVCRRLNAAHGRTYYFATRFLPPARRRHVHALYGFARYADDLVDHLDLGWTPLQRRTAFESWSEQALDALASGEADDPVLRALGHTVAALGIDHGDLRVFLRSMAMDLTVTRYETYDDLAGYVHGSAGVIGTMMLPILDAGGHEPRGPAMDLGVAFQLTNFLRDVAEDWDRGRIYLPLEDLDRFGVTEWDFRARHVGPSFRRLLAFEIARARAVYRRAERGWAMLPPASARSIRIAHRLYAQILDRIEAADHQVFRRRARVPARRKAAVALHELVRPPSPRGRRVP